MKRFTLILFFLTLFVKAHCHHPLIMTYAYNRPDFIELQCKTFQKFLLDDYEFIVFNDSPPGPVHDEIVKMCALWGVECIDVPQSLHNREYTADEKVYSIYSRRHTNAIQYSLEIRGYAHIGPLVLFDGDMFLIRPFSIKEMLREVDIASVFRISNKKVSYLWPGLVMLSMDRLPDKSSLKFYCGRVEDCYVDSGGLSALYLLAHSNLNIKEFDQIFSFQIFCPDKFGNYDNMISVGRDNVTRKKVKIRKLMDMGFNNKEIQFILKEPDTINFACNNCFLHYRNSSGWGGSENEEYNKIKTALFNEFINDILN